MRLSPTCPDGRVHCTVYVELELLPRSQKCDSIGARSHLRPVAKRRARGSSKRHRRKHSPCNQVSTACGRIKCTLTGPRLSPVSDSSRSSHDGDDDPPSTTPKGKRTSYPKTKSKSSTDVAVLSVEGDDSKPFQDNVDRKCHSFKSKDLEEFSREQKSAMNTLKRKRSSSIFKQKTSNPDRILSQMKLDGECSEDSECQGLISIVITLPISKKAMKCCKTFRMSPKSPQLDRMPDCAAEIDELSSKTNSTAKPPAKDLQFMQNIEEESDFPKHSSTTMLTGLDCEYHSSKMKSSADGIGVDFDLPVRSGGSADDLECQEQFASSQESAEVMVVTNYSDESEPPEEVTPGSPRSSDDTPIKISYMSVAGESMFANIPVKSEAEGEEESCFPVPIFLLPSSNEEDLSKDPPIKIKINSVGEPDGSLGGPEASIADGSDCGEGGSLVRGVSSLTPEQNRLSLTEPSSSSSDSTFCPGSDST